MPRTRKSGAYPTKVECRRRPTLPHPGECSTIGAGRLSYRVRNGTGRFPTAMTTDNTIQLSPHPKPGTGVEHTQPIHQPPNDRKRGWLWTQGHTVDANNSLWQALGLLVPVNSTPHRASISGLSTQSSTGSLTHSKVVGDLILEQASRLDAFSGYPSRT